MPPLFEGQEDEDDEDLVVADTTVVLHCPLTTNYLESPMTSKFCGHSYSKRAIVEYLCNSKKQCPVVGCVHTISVKDLYENKKLERRIERIRRYKLAREKSQNYTTLQ
ncbi:E3 SUMO-protein ligase NSE2 [Zancudomyces culisetae]|uniref:E3 SUMO-protein ligase NSE2 n=1 Tax=Zancudomyces culisetae TaxID=1213189 RepID=A0A1R1PVD3_ZANCU|nr:E3 SUMO-protein ligase NSE2 [Zancudomyces culisetae]|eukprot:OMH84904.1 E3 SUMO-protein ligase NSE2 [Zancudomyces culisetae]